MLDATDATDDAVVRRQFDTDEAPTTAVAETVAELEGRSATDPAALYDCVDHVLDHLFSNPPAPEAKVRVAFTYEGYRMTADLTQDDRGKTVVHDDTRIGTVTDVRSGTAYVDPDFDHVTDDLRAALDWDDCVDHTIESADVTAVRNAEVRLRTDLLP